MTDCEQLKILFCCDGSRQAEKAVRFGLQIAVACKAKCSILGIAEKILDEHGLIRALQHVQNIFEEENLETELITKVGRPVPEIVRHANEFSYDLVVIGASRKNTLWRLFDPVWMSVKVYDIVESIAPPVLVVIGSRTSVNRILICSGGTEHTDKAIKFAGAIAQAANAVVNLIHVMPEVPGMYADLVQFEEDTDRILESNSELGQILRRQKELLEQHGVFGEVIVRSGDVVPELLNELKRTDYDLIVSGSLPAKEKLRKYVMGDVAREIVNRAGIPVLVLRTVEKMKIGRIFKEFLGRLFQAPEKVVRTN